MTRASNKQEEDGDHVVTRGENLMSSAPPGSKRVSKRSKGGGGARGSLLSRGSQLLASLPLASSQKAISSFVELVGKQLGINDYVWQTFLNSVVVILIISPVMAAQAHLWMAYIRQVILVINMIHIDIY